MLPAAESLKAFEMPQLELAILSRERVQWDDGTICGQFWVRWDSGRRVARDPQCSVSACLSHQVDSGSDFAEKLRCESLDRLCLLLGEHVRVLLQSEGHAPVAKSH